MEVYAARQPIFKKDQQLYGYELLYRRTQENFFQGSDDTQATAALINNAFLVMDLADLTGGRRAFINFSRELLVKQIPLLLPREQIVVEILERVDPDDEVVESCRELHKKGYTLALDDFVLREDYWPLMELAQIIKVEYGAYSHEGHRQLARMFQGKKMLVERVETREEFQQAVAWGYDYFQGYFFSKPVMLKGREIMSLNPVLLEILQELTQEEPSYRKISDGIGRDLSLSFKFLKMANKMRFGARYPVESLEKALVRMGFSEIRKWVYVMLLNESRRPDNAEMIRKSIIRGRMMNLIAREIAEERDRLNFFLVGLFSLLDRILAKPMEELTRHLPLSESVKTALLGGDNRLAQWLGQVVAFECGEETGTMAEVDRSSFSEERLMSLYMDAVRWGNELEGLS